MSTTESITCTRIVRPENFADQFGSLVTTLHCDMPMHDSWGNFFSNPTLFIGAMAAIGTIGAVVVALRQSKHARTTAFQARIDAIEISEKADELALKRELRINELERFEALIELTVQFASSADASSKEMNDSSVRLAFGLQKFFVYLSQTEPALVEPFSSAMHLLRKAIEVVNECRNPTRDTSGRLNDRHSHLKTWIAEQPRLTEDFLVIAGELIRILGRYYEGSRSLSQTLAELGRASNVISTRYKPLIDCYSEVEDSLG